MSNIAVHIPQLSLEQGNTLPQQTSAGSIGKQSFSPILLSFPFSTADFPVILHL